MAKSPITTSIDSHRPPIVADQQPGSPKDQVMIRSVSTELSTESGHDTSPEYELEDPTNATGPHSPGGNIQMQAWHGEDDEALSAEPYVFDRRSRGLVRSRSEGHATTLHPYVGQSLSVYFRSDRPSYCQVRVFRSPIGGKCHRLCSFSSFLTVFRYI